MDFIDLDDEIEARTGADVSLIFEIEGETGFRKRESETLAQTSERNGIVLATGGGAVLSPDNRRFLSARGFVVFLKTNVEQQLCRLERDKRRPLLQAPNRVEILQTMAKTRNPLYEQTADLTVVSEALSVKVMANKVIEHIEQAIHIHAGS